MRRSRDERGATLIMVAFAFFTFAVIAAVVVDLAAARTDRASNQISADNAATAAAGVLHLGGGKGACEVAVGYIEEHNGGIPLTGADCTGFPTTCSNSTTSVATTGTSGSMTIDLIYPVADNDPLMSPGAVGATSRPVVVADGDRCDRFGVRIGEIHSTFFGQVVGIDTLQTSIHAVALAKFNTDVGRALNLLLLEKHDCAVLNVSGGGGGQGGIVVNSVIDDINNLVLPGRINLDSDGTGSCSSKGVISAGGNGAVIRGDGPPGCPGELVVVGPGAGCGELEVVAPGPPGCVMPACSSTGLVAPNPTQVTKPLTRAMVDWRFNCKLTYPASFGISRCPNAATRPAYIDSLVGAVGPSGIPPGFRSYKAAGYPCTVKDPLPLTIPIDNWVVDCNLKIFDELRFRGGNIIFNGNVTLSGQATLRINVSNSNSFSWTDGAPLDITKHSGQASFVYLRNGTISKGSQSHLELDKTMVYVSATSTLDVGGGSGSLRWVSPTTGPFEDLALWSETSAAHAFGGGSSLELEGVLFAPYADFSYSGNGSQQQVAAQFISRTLSTNGAGLLNIQPVASRSVLFPYVTATLIR